MTDLTRLDGSPLETLIDDVPDPSWVLAGGLVCLGVGITAGFLIAAGLAGLLAS